MRQGFSGFTDEGLSLTPLPKEFFTELLPMIDHLGELQITLYTFWALDHKEGNFRYLSYQEIAEDDQLLNFLHASGLSPEDALQDSLERAVSRGTLLSVSLSEGDEDQVYYFLNAPGGQTAVASIEAGHWSPSGEVDAPIRLSNERPNIFNLYEQNIGPLTPLIADSLRDAEQEYPPDWIEEAFRIAVENNVRKWRYIEAVLEDWKRRGKDSQDDRSDSEKSRRRYIQGEFSDHLDT